jgi:hypothetical protein
MTMRLQARLAASLLTLVVSARPALAAGDNAPDPEKDFGDKADASARRASDMLPFLVDHPELLRRLQQRVQGQRSAADDAANPAPAVAQQRIITIAPGEPGPVNEIDTMQGYPTTISFIDVTGARWPIHWEVKTAVYPRQPPAPTQVSSPRRDTNTNQPDETYTQEATAIAAVTVGHGFDYTVPVKGRDGNSINVMTLSPNPRGGMNIMLEGAKSTVPFQLRAAGLQGGDYDAQVTVRIMARGPDAAPAMAVRADDTPTTGAAFMTDMLEGHAPADATPLDTIGLSADRVRAWQRGNYDYIRTDVTILSPQPLSFAAGENASIYQIPQAAVVLISDNGRTSSLRLTGGK